MKVSEHRRNFEFAHSGDASEHVQIESSSEQVTVQLVHSLEASRPYEELRATVWYVANQPGATVVLHVRLPHQIDPKTGRPLVFKIRGTTYTSTDRWQQLSVATTSEAIQQQEQLTLRRLSSEIATLDSRDMVVDRISLELPVKPGVTELLIDDLVFGQIVPPNAVQTVDLAAGTQEKRQESPIQLGPKRILVNDKPFFPVFAAYQGENLDAIRDMGINVALIERADEQILMDELARRDIWVMATPPPALQEDDGSAIATKRSLTIPSSTSRVLFWMLGTRIPTDELPKVDRWIDQIRDADRAFTQPRPIMADVVGDERAFSRKVSLLGNSRHILHTTTSPLQYRDYLQYKKNLALPDRFTFSWLQTEPAPPNVTTRSSADRPILVEAEQIWMQALTEISVGHRGIGYWKSSPLDENSSAARERGLAIALMNEQIKLLEPFLATGSVVDTIPVRVRKTPQAPPSTGSRFLPSLRRAQEPVQAIHPEIRAAVIESGYGRLVIPNWYENGAQFQPGAMYEDRVSFVVRGVEQAHAWEVTTTSIRPLELDQPVPGGMEFRLPEIDQRAFVIITNDLELQDRLSQQMRERQQRCARLWIELARARLDRVLPTHELLQQVAGTKVRDGDALMRSASTQLDQAEIQFQSQRYDDARILSRRALRLLRQLQRAHWENAVRDLTSPVSSPHTVCFETLPDHWRMIEAIGRSGGTDQENLLRSGDFEDFDTVKVEWDFETTEPDNLHRVELLTAAHSGRYSLRLVSEPEAANQPVDVSAPPNVRVISPSVPVQGGQIVILSGKIRIEEPITGHPDGLMLYENIKGTVGALRWHESMPADQWQSFRVIREVHHSRDFQFWIELNGIGDARFDDIRVTTLNPLQTVSGERSWSDRPRRNLLDFTPSLPKFPLWSGRKSEPAQN